MAVTAVLDSGSTDIYLPKEIAEILGLKLEKAIQGFGIEGPVMVHPSIVSISIGKGAVEKTATLPCFVSGTDHFVDILFGRMFFRLFDITFKESDQKVILKEISEEVFSKRLAKHTKVY